MLNNKKVLLVDDDPETLDLLERFFIQCRCGTLRAQSVAQAFGIISNALALIVTDWDIPHLNGTDLLMMVRHLFPSIPVIGISGHPPIETRAVAKKFNGFLNKPFRIKDLKAVVKSVSRIEVY